MESDQIAHLFNTVAGGDNKESLCYFAFAAGRMVDFLKPQPG